MKLKDRVAIITGGGRGLGRQIALTFAREGAKVVIAGPVKEENDEVARKIRSLRRQCLPLLMDIRDEGQVVSVVRETIRKFRRIDILVNNSGIAGPTAPVHRISRQEWQQVIDIDLTGAFLFTKHVVPHMIERKQGRIINISSIAGKIGYELRTPYAAAKWGLIGLTRTLAKELGQHNILVNAICPGPVEGERMQQVIADKAKATGRSYAEVEQEYLEKMVIKRLVPPQDIAAMALFLASDEAGSITGQAISVDCGYQL